MKTIVPAPTLGVTDASHPFKPNRWICLGLIFGWALLLRIPIAHIPLDRDEGEYAYIAQRALMGEIPYKTSFDQKPPGAFLMYALIERYMGTRPATIHWGTQLYILGTLALVSFLGEKLFSGFVGALAAFLLALMVVDTTVTGNSSNTEIFMILPLTGALYTTLLTEEKGSIVWGFITGLLLGASGLFKQVALTNGVFILLYLAIKNPNTVRLLNLSARAIPSNKLAGGEREKGWDRRIPLMLSVVGGAGVIFSITAAYFMTVGAGKEFYDSVIGFNLSYASLMPWAGYPKQFWQSFYPQLKTFGPVYVLAVLGIASGFRRRPSFRMLSGWLLFSFGGVLLGGYFREHYFIQILPAIALLAAGQLVLMTSQRGPRYFYVLSAAGVGLIILFAVWRGAWYYGPAGPAEKARKIYGINPFVESLPVGRYIADHSGPSDRVFIFGSEPQILYYAARRSASRYFYMYPLMAGFDARARQQQVLLDLLNQPPKFIVTVFVPTSQGVSDAGNPIFADLHNVLQRFYELVAVVPNSSLGPIKIIDGPPAQEQWNRNPFWYSGRPWCTLAIWQRKA